MKKLTVKFVLLLGAVLFIQAQMQAQKVNLLVGNDLSAWVIENNGQFSFDDGLLKINRGTGWLRSKEEFADFKLIMKFRFLDIGANSGIFIRTAATSHKDENGWPDNGYQIQCKDTIQGDVPLAKLIPYGAPPFEFDFKQEILEKAYKPTGKWQTYKIICNKEDLKVYLNNKLVTTANQIKNLKGHIGIQGEHGRLEFKKIVVSKL